MATWPHNVPAPALDGYQYEPADLTVRTQMSAGLPRVRRVSVGKFGQVNFMLKCSAAQAAVFEEWFYEAAGANAGAAWFSLRLKLPSGTSEKMCRIVGKYQSQLMGNGRWQFSGVMEVSYA